MARLNSRGARSQYKAAVPESSQAMPRSQGSRRVGPFACTQCSPPTTWETYRKLSYHRENHHRMSFEFDVNGQTVVATRSKVDHKISCLKCSGRWSDLNSFKKHVRDVCGPPAQSAARPTSRCHLPPAPAPASSPLSSLPTSSAPPSPPTPSLSSSAAAHRALSDAGRNRHQRRSLHGDAEASAAARSPKTAHASRHATWDSKTAITFPAPVTPILRGPFGPPATGSRIAAARQHSTAASDETAEPTSKRHRRKQRVHSLESVWEPVERKAGLSLKDEFRRSQRRAAKDSGGDQTLVGPWWESVPFLATHDSETKHEDGIWAVEWTSQDQVVSASGDGRLKVWDLEGKLVNDSSLEHPLGIVSLSVAPSGRSALANSQDGTTILHSLDGSAAPLVHESFLEHVARQDGQSFATADDEPSVNRTTWGVSLHPDERVFAACGAGGKVGVRTATSSSEDGDRFGKLLRELETGREKFGLSVRFSPDGQTLALSSENGQIFIFDVETGTLRNTYSSHNVAVRALTWSPDSQYLYSGSDDKSIVLHDVRSAPTAAAQQHGQKSGVATLTGHSSWVLSLSASMSSTHSLLSGSADKTVKVWDARAGGKGGEKGGCVGTFGEGAEVWGVSWRPFEANQAEVGKRFVSAGDERAIRWWRAAGTEQ